MKITSVLILCILFSRCFDNHSNVNDNHKRDINLKTEKLVIEDNDVGEPKGSQILWKSHKNYAFYNLTGYWLSEVDHTNCEAPDYSRKFSENQIKFIELTDSTMEISFSFLAKCGSDFLFEVELIDSNVLNILCHGYGSLASCTCEYHSKYLFVDRDYLEGLEMDNVKLKYISVNNGRKELISNYLNE